MSYSFNNPCWAGQKREVCKDEAKIREAVQHIHCDNDGTHHGGGEILMMCSRIASKPEVEAAEKLGVYPAEK